jgi:hypothetical protein
MYRKGMVSELHCMTCGLEDRFGARYGYLRIEYVIVSFLSFFLHRHGIWDSIAWRIFLFWHGYLDVPTRNTVLDRGIWKFAGGQRGHFDGEPQPWAVCVCVCRVLLLFSLSLVRQQTNQVNKRKRLSRLYEKRC